MSYIFLDESGDLGFDFSKNKTSKYFIISFLFVKSKSPVEKIVKKIFSNMPENQRKKHSGVLHAYKEQPKTRKKLLEELKKKDVSILAIYLNKSKVYTKLQDEKHILYNYVTNILLDRIYSKKLIPDDEKVFLIASKRETNKFLNANFTDYLTNQLYKNHQIKLEIEIKHPSAEKCLQIVDCVSWSLFRKWEHKDNSYYQIIKSKIVEENGLFP
jgi:hypothetical protein